MSRTRPIATASAAVLIALAGFAAAGPAQAKDGDVITRGTCSKGSEWKLKASPENGRIEVEAEIDSNRVGQVWSVSLKDNGVSVFSGQRTTVAPSGSFEVRRVIRNRAGRDVITLTATTASTGETCSGSLTY